MTPLRPARADELRRIWRAVSSTGLFTGSSDLVHAAESHPYRIMVAGHGRDIAVVVSRAWRLGYPILGVQYIACVPAARRALVAGLGQAALQHGFTRVLSPMLAAEDAAPFVYNGYARCESVYLLAASVGRRFGASGRFRGSGVPRGIALRPAERADAQEVLDVDRLSFDRFWRFGADDLDEFMSRHLTLVATAENGQVVGYTMGSVTGGAGNVIRLAVAPGWRQQGVASGLVTELVSGMRRHRVKRVMLCTQADNVASQRLYEKLGFTKIGPELSIYARDSQEPQAT